MPIAVGCHGRRKLRFAFRAGFYWQKRGDATLQSGRAAPALRPRFPTRPLGRRAETVELPAGSVL